MFAKAYDLAREQGAEALLDRIQAIADGVEDPASLAIAKLKIDALKLRMVRLASRSGEARQPSAQPEPISHLEALAELE